MSIIAKSKIVKTSAGDFTLSFYDGATPITLYLPHEFDGDYRVSCPSQNLAEGQECGVEIINPLPGVAPMMAVPFSQNSNPGLSYQSFIEAVIPPTSPTNPTANTNKPKSQTAMYLVLVLVLLVIAALVIWYFKFRK